MKEMYKKIAKQYGVMPKEVKKEINQILELCWMAPGLGFTKKPTTEEFIQKLAACSLQGNTLKR